MKNWDKMAQGMRLWDYPFSTYAKFSKKLTFLALWYTHVRVCVRGWKNVELSEYFAYIFYVLNGWPLFQSRWSYNIKTPHDIDTSALNGSKIINRFGFLMLIILSLSWRGPLSNRNQSIDRVNVPFQCPLKKHKFMTFLGKESKGYIGKKWIKLEQNLTIPLPIPTKREN